MWHVSLFADEMKAPIQSHGADLGYKLASKRTVTYHDKMGIGLPPRKGGCSGYEYLMRFDGLQPSDSTKENSMLRNAVGAAPCGVTRPHTKVTEIGARIDYFHLHFRTDLASGEIIRNCFGHGRDAGSPRFSHLRRPPPSSQGWAFWLMLTTNCPNPGKLRPLNHSFSLKINSRNDMRMYKVGMQFF